MSKPKYTNYSKTQMINFIETSNSMEEVLMKMEYSHPNDNRFITGVRNYCTQLEIEHSHLPNILNEDIIVCNICGKEKSKEEFYFSNGKLSQKVCKICVRQKEKEKYNQKQIKLIDYKKEQKCIKCGCTKHYLLDFHHVNPKEKDYTISDNSHAKFETLLKEIKKCVPLCSNCHREFHYLEKEQGITLNEYLGAMA